MLEILNAFFVELRNVIDLCKDLGVGARLDKSLKVGINKIDWVLFPGVDVKNLQFFYELSLLSIILGAELRFELLTFVFQPSDNFPEAIINVFHLLFTHLANLFSLLLDEADIVIVDNSRAIHKLAQIQDVLPYNVHHLFQLG